ncbi:MlaD family protein [Pseudomonas aeruginosa]|uniref:MlaD family protein n=1 Tax=Pseudomonas aeruginosa TaxID=287 RepID=UPI004056C406
MARGVEIQLSIDNADGLREGTPIRFKGLDIGKIESVELNPDLSGSSARRFRSCRCPGP